MGDYIRDNYFGFERGNLAHITPGRKKDPFYINVRNPLPQKV